MALKPHSIRELQPIEEVALDTVVSVVNRAKEQLGERQTLKDLARCRELFAGKTKLQVTSLRPPLAITAKELIEDTIIFEWKLTDLFMYCINYKNTSDDETSHYFYYEVIFSQPSAKYPIPQATAKVFFRAQEKYTHPPINAPAPEANSFPAGGPPDVPRHPLRHAVARVVVGHHQDEDHIIQAY